MLVVGMMSQLLKRLDAARHSLRGDGLDSKMVYLSVHDLTNPQPFGIHVKCFNTFAFFFFLGVIFLFTYFAKSIICFNFFPLSIVWL